MVGNIPSALSALSNARRATTRSRPIRLSMARALRHCRRRPALTARWIFDQASRCQAALLATVVESETRSFAFRRQPAFRASQALRQTPPLSSTDGGTCHVIAVRVRSMCDMTDRAAPQAPSHDWVHGSGRSPGASRLSLGTACADLQTKRTKAEQLFSLRHSSFVAP